jgi:hypothetical protein
VAHDATVVRSIEAGGHVALEDFSGELEIASIKREFGYSP